MRRSPVPTEYFLFTLTAIFIIQGGGLLQPMAHKNTPTLQASVSVVPQIYKQKVDWLKKMAIVKNRELS